MLPTEKGSQHLLTLNLPLSYFDSTQRMMIGILKKIYYVEFIIKLICEQLQQEKNIKYSFIWLLYPINQIYCYVNL